MSEAAAKAILEYTRDGVKPPYREDIVRLALDYLDLQARAKELEKIIDENKAEAGAEVDRHQLRPYFWLVDPVQVYLKRDGKAVLCKMENGKAVPCDK